MRPQALPDHSFVRFVMTTDAIVPAARGAGAKTILETLRMEGTIPAYEP
jgi:hypothetical protein